MITFIFRGGRGGKAGKAGKAGGGRKKAPARRRSYYEDEEEDSDFESATVKKKAKSLVSSGQRLWLQWESFILRLCVYIQELFFLSYLALISAFTHRWCG